MEYKRGKISPKMKYIMMEILRMVNDHPEISAPEICEKLQFPKPVIILALYLLRNNNILTAKNENNIYCYTLTKSPSLLFSYNEISKITLDTDCNDYNHYIDYASRTPYKMPPELSNITIKELNYKDYLYSKELYDYEILTLFKSNNNTNPYFAKEYLLRQFAYNLCKCDPDKHVHIYTAEKDGKTLGFVSLSNYSGDIMKNRLPCNSSKIYTVSYISVRKEASNHSIATNLLTFAINDLLNQEDVFAINYNPICVQSKHVMQKVFAAPAFYIYERDYSPMDIELLGELSSYVIFPEKNRFIVENLKSDENNIE